MKIQIRNFSRFAYVRHAYNFLKSGFKLLYILIFVFLGIFILKRNINWTLNILNESNFHHMPKGIICMAKNLTEVVENIKEDQRKEFYLVTSFKGKIFVFATTLFFDIVVIFFLIATLKAR